MAVEVELKEFIEAQIRSLEASLEQYMQEHRREHSALAAQVSRDAGTIDKRLEGMNELRQQINSERSLYVTRDALDARMQAIQQRIDDAIRQSTLSDEANVKRIANLEQTRANLDGRIAMLGAMLVFIQVGISFLFHFFK